MMQEVVEQVRKTAESVIETVHTCMPAEILAYNPQRGTVDCKPVGMYYSGDSAMPYPPIYGIPLYVMASSDGTAVCVPVKAGDSCLLCFGEQNISQWRDGTGASNANQRFQLMNAFAIPGLQRAAVTAQNEANAAGTAVVAAGSVRLVVSASGVSIKGNLTVDGTIRATGNVSAPNIE